jgi:HEAT repeat protein
MKWFTLPMPLLATVGALSAPTGFLLRAQSVHERFDTTAPFLVEQGDPADSVYRAAHQLINRGDWRRATELFSELIGRHPRSAYVCDAMYWQAFARYRIGGTRELEAAARILENVVAKARELRRRSTSDAEVAKLLSRVYGELAKRGNPDARVKLERQIGQSGRQLCDPEDQEVATEALNAVVQLDPAGATPMLTRVLSRRDECSAELRRNAVFMLGRRLDGDAAMTLISAAKFDPSADVRISAIAWLPRVSGEAPILVLDEIVRTDSSSRIQSSALKALATSNNPNAHRSLRALMERKDVAEAIRVTAINTLDKDRSTADMPTFLRALYGQAESDRLKSTIIDAVGRIGGPEDGRWILSIATNPDESYQARAAALSRVRQMDLSIGDLGKLYDAAGSRNTREQIIDMLARRREPEATDKLIDIVKNSTGQSARIAAVNALQHRNDPRASKFLMDFVGKP